jgi:hypothetical protein
MLIKGTPKEIAELVLSLQTRQLKSNLSRDYRKTLSELIQKAVKGEH